MCMLCHLRWTIDPRKEVKDMSISEKTVFMAIVISSLLEKGSYPLFQMDQQVQNQKRKIKDRVHTRQRFDLPKNIKQLHSFLSIYHNPK